MRSLSLFGRRGGFAFTPGLVLFFAFVQGGKNAPGDKKIDSSGPKKKRPPRPRGVLPVPIFLDSPKMTTSPVFSSQGAYFSARRVFSAPTGASRLRYQWRRLSRDTRSRRTCRHRSTGGPIYREGSGKNRAPEG